MSFLRTANVFCSSAGMIKIQVNKGIISEETVVCGAVSLTLGEGKICFNQQLFDKVILLS